MIGTIANTCTILIGSLLGSCLKKGLKESYSDALFTAMGLAAFFIGVNAVVQNMPKSGYPVLFIASLAIGSLLGAVLDIDARFKGLVSRFSRSNLGEGLSTAVLLFCIGTLSILGPIQAALFADHTYLFTNATLDLVTSAVLSSAYGIGIAFAAPILFVWQGLIYLFAGFLSESLSDGLLCEISILGGILIAASGISILKLREIKTLNLLPALLVPPVWFLFTGFLG